MARSCKALTAILRSIGFPVRSWGVSGVLLKQGVEAIRFALTKEDIFGAPEMSVIG